MIDLVIIGGGPAALSGALYAARAGLNVRVYEKANFGGVLPNIPLISNYPGYRGDGAALAENMRVQAEQAGAELEYGECTNIRKVVREDDPDARGIFQLEIDEEMIEARAVLVATGSEPKKLSFTPDAPVSYCALCDGPLARGKNVAVIGGANSAVQEALFLADIAKKVTIITHSAVRADAELQEKLKNHSNIRIIEHLEPTAENLQGYDYVFVYIGKQPATAFLQELGEKYAILGRDGYVLADVNNAEFPHQTVLAGLFTAGDVRDGAVKQAIIAAADGAEAAIEVKNYLK